MRSLRTRRLGRDSDRQYAIKAGTSISANGWGAHSPLLTFMASPVLSSAIAGILLFRFGYPITITQILLRKVFSRDTTDELVVRERGAALPLIHSPVIWGAADGIARS
ncbi:hypothetical protein PG984_003784 [Apiospora sp. TS-2023a]